MWKPYIGVDTTIETLWFGIGFYKHEGSFGINLQLKDKFFWIGLRNGKEY